MAGEMKAQLWAGWRGLRRGLVDVLFPGACTSCGDELADAPSEIELPFCADCLESFELFDGPTCEQCGVALRETECLRESKRGGCVYCDGRKLWFDGTIAAGLYAGRLRELLLRMKHAQGQGLALAIGRLVAETCREKLARVEPDVVAPVPMHWRRRLMRGSNSASILAEVLAGELRAPLAEGLLRRRRPTRPQFECTPPQRWDNVRRAFSVAAGYHLRNAHVLLVDDILTTGATCSETARELLRSGASRVTVAVVARSISG